MHVSDITVHITVYKITREILNFEKFVSLWWKSWRKNKVF